MYHLFHPFRYGCEVIAVSFSSLSLFGLKITEYILLCAGGE